MGVEDDIVTVGRLSAVPSWPLDDDRVQQVGSNLLSKAIHHGEKASPVRIGVAAKADAPELAVTNRSAPLDAATRQRMFQPYAKSGGGGLKLGLYIVAEIMKSHGGTVEVVTPFERDVSFVCRFPG